MNCLWTITDDGWFNTSCGNAFEFTTHGPTENKFKFCPYCGNSATAIPMEPPKPDPFEEWWKKECDRNVDYPTDRISLLRIGWDAAMKHKEGK